MGYEFFTLMMLLCFFISIFASTSLKSTYKKYMKIQNSSHFSGAQVAASILRQFGINDVRVEETSGELSDHYDPRHKVVRLSTENYHGTSIAAVSVAAHECGHAIQHATEYVPVVIRSKMVPVVNFANKMSYGLFAVSLFIDNYQAVLKLAFLIFFVTFLFQVVTLPVEFDASKRALKILNSSNVLQEHEMKGSKKVLKAAAFTYVAGVLYSLMQVLRILSVLNRRDS
ncbi:MAG: zinc metallopeptidase [Lachnospiraceae bacterium]|nr:zinc metallopeptidase [Lachnospiraceae bacterium]